MKKPLLALAATALLLMSATPSFARDHDDKSDRGHDRHDNRHDNHHDDWRRDDWRRYHRPYPVYRPVVVHRPYYVAPYYSGTTIVGDGYSYSYGTTRYVTSPRPVVVERVIEREPVVVRPAGGNACMDRVAAATIDRYGEGTNIAFLDSGNIGTVMIDGMRHNYSCTPAGINIWQN